MDLNGQKVKHKTFGEGTIIEQTNEYLIVSFAQGNKRFVYPDAFSSFITALDPNIHTAVNKEIVEIEAEKLASLAAEKKKQAESTSAAANAVRPISRKTYNLSYSYDVEASPHGQHYYFVFQNKSFEAERRGGYLWAPKSHLDGRIVSHWKLMEDVKEGDVIFHSVNKNIVAISIATSSCYSAAQPPELKQERMWQDDGWRVESQYTLIKWPIVTSDCMANIIELQPSKYAPFNILGRGNTGYLFASNYEMAKFLFEKLLVKNTYLNELADKIGIERL